MVKGARRHLCAECSEADFCDRPKRCGEPVLECETFRQGRGKSTAPRPGSRRPSAEDLREEKEVSLGLCRTCTHRRVCAYLKRKGGVWHCEEFAQSE